MEESVEKAYREAAKSCKDCLGWHAICGAICCKMFVVNRPEGWKGIKKGDIINQPTKVPPSMKWYYKLHGARLEHGTLRFKLDDFSVVGASLFVLNKCELLGDDLRCTGHPDKYPSICKEFTEETYGSKKFNNFPECLYRFKKELAEEQRLNNPKSI